MKDFDYYIEDFMLFCSAKNLAKKTMKSYEQTLKLFQLYMKNEHKIEEVDKVGSREVRFYIKNLQERGKYTVQVANSHINNPQNRTDRGKSISTTTINNYLRNIKVFYNYLLDEEIIRDNPMAKIKQLKVTKEKKEPMSKEEVRRVLKAFDISTFHGYRDYVITKLLLSTGARIGETLSLEDDCINFKNNTIIFRDDTKSRKEKIAFMNNKLANELKRWMRYKERYMDVYYLFPSIRKNAMKVQNFEQNLRKLADKIDLENVTPHRFRRTFAVEYLKAGGRIEVLSVILQHASVQTTEIYLNMDEEYIRKEYLKYNPIDLIDF